MKHIFLNLKRFDIPREMGGVNSIAEPAEWGSFIVSRIQDGVKKLQETADGETEFIVYLPEAHVIPAVQAKKEDSPVVIGSQSVFRDDAAEFRGVYGKPHGKGHESLRLRQRSHRPL